MRFAVFMGLLCLCACASDRLALTPPRGVDFSGQWRLNEADSDDPIRLIQAQAVDPSKATAAGGGQGGQGGQGGGGRGGRRGGGFGGGPGVAGPMGPTMPAVGALRDGLRWPSKDLDVRQNGGVVSISSGGIERVYKPTRGDKKPHAKKRADDEHRPEDVDAPPVDATARAPFRGRGDGAPAICGWDDKSLVVQGEPDDDHPSFEQRYLLSDDGRRLIEVVTFKGGRSNGYTVSRVWDRVVPGAPPPSEAEIDVSPLIPRDAH